MQSRMDKNHEADDAKETEDAKEEALSVKEVSQNDAVSADLEFASEYADEADSDVADSDVAGSDEADSDEADSEESDSEEADSDEGASNIVVRRVRTKPSDVIPAPSKEKGLMYSLLDTLRFISLGLVIGILLVVFVVQRNDVYGPSMEPNLHEKDAVFVEMVTKYFTTPERGQIMTINATGLSGYSKEEKIIKRVIGLPGETVTIKDGSVYINGVLLNEPYLASDVRTYMNDDGIASGYDNITLKAGEYYFMGDNRGASLDSRVLGPIPTSRIKSHVFAKIYPFDDMGLL